MRKILFRTLAICALLIGTLTWSSSAQSSKNKSRSLDTEQQKPIHIGDFVYIMMPNGKEVVAVIKGKLIGNKYFVRKYKSNFQGEVNKKYVRPMTTEELIALKKKYAQPFSTGSRY